MNYRLSMKLDGTDCSRVVTVPEHLGFEDFHGVVNKLFGFDNSHPWQFSNKECVLHLGCEVLVHRTFDEKRWVTWPHLVQLRDVFDKVGKRVYYEYDFGDGWRVTIRRMSNPKTNDVACETTTGTYALDDIGGAVGLMSYRRRLAASTLNLKSDEEERAYGYDDMLAWWGFGQKTKREKFLAGPTLDELTETLHNSIGEGSDFRLTGNERYFHPESQPIDAEYGCLEEPSSRRDELLARYDAAKTVWAAVANEKIMPLITKRKVKAAATALGLCSRDGRKVIVENQAEHDVLCDYVVMLQRENGERIADRFIRSAEKSADEKLRFVGKMLSTYCYRCLRVKNFICGVGLVATDLFEGKDYLVVNVALSKNGGNMPYLTLFGGFAEVDDFLFGMESIIPYDLPNVESVIDGNLADIDMGREIGRQLTIEQQEPFAAKCIKDLVESGYTLRIA
ncbi:MAG: hypothetical protein IJG84_06775 [Kiritimatiellae bacterium]|nr:hypothetical protein [Kiritimatiellia bacterium]